MYLRLSRSHDTYIAYISRWSSLDAGSQLSTERADVHRTLRRQLQQRAQPKTVAVVVTINWFSVVQSEAKSAGSREAHEFPPGTVTGEARAIQVDSKTIRPICILPHKMG